MSASPVGLYIHIPFCRAKCGYCDFNSYPHLEHLHEPYTHALCAEMRQFAHQHGRLAVDTIYLGGGTPTCLATRLLTEILANARNAFLVAADAEITVEANPGTVTSENASALHSAGVDRLSLGAQSFRDEELHLLGRIHDKAEIHKAILLARSAGIANISLDLIYGLPQQALIAWRSSLEAALALEPTHLSLYALSVEDATPLAQSIASKQLPRPDPDLAADMYILAEDLLARAAYEHYELSNWARAALAADDAQMHRPLGNTAWAQCRHNLKYWRREPYLGFGAGAHSFHAGRRRHNVLSPEAYVTRLQNGQSVVECEQRIDHSEAMAETMILSLRLIEGVRFSDFQRQHRQDMHQQYGTELDELRELGLLTFDARAVRLTPRGRLLANQAFGRFWPPSHHTAGPVAVKQNPPRCHEQFSWTQA
jgi:oxygen-independent coproporphyrinogen-3 oxidase